VVFPTSSLTSPPGQVVRSLRPPNPSRDRNARDAGQLLLSSVDAGQEFAECVVSEHVEHDPCHTGYPDIFHPESVHDGKRRRPSEVTGACLWCARRTRAGEVSHSLVTNQPH
jgi:hypothetical protein